MRRLLSIIVSLVTAISFAQQPVELPLWPDGAPNSSGLTGEEQETRPHFVTNVTHPTLTVYHPEKPNGMAIIMCPGGGYRGLGIDGEGYDMAPWFCGQGITYMVLKYRMPNGDRTLPISDAEAAMKLVRDSADVWNLNPNDIGIMGSSAGGHLAAALGTIGSDETVPAGYRPNLSVLYYPVIDMVSRGYGFPEIKRDFEKISPIHHVSEATPSTLILLGTKDPIVSVETIEAYQDKLLQKGVDCELHLFEGAGHPIFLYRKPLTEEYYKVRKLTDDFLKRQGFL